MPTVTINESSNEFYDLPSVATRNRYPDEPDPFDDGRVHRRMTDAEIEHVARVRGSPEHKAQRAQRVQAMNVADFGTIHAELLEAKRGLDAGTLDPGELQNRWVSLVEASRDIVLDERWKNHLMDLQIGVLDALHARGFGADEMLPFTTQEFQRIGSDAYKLKNLVAAGSRPPAELLTAFRCMVGIARHVSLPAEFQAKLVTMQSSVLEVLSSHGIEVAPEDQLSFALSGGGPLFSELSVASAAMLALTFAMAFVSGCVGH